MVKRKKRRSREFKENNEKVDIEEARRLRREKRSALIAEKEAAARPVKIKKEVSKRMKAKKRKKALLYLGIAVFLCAIFAASVWNVVSVRLQYREVKNEQASLEEQKDRLTKELENVDNLEYVEQEARALLRMIKPGEILYVLPDTDSTDKDATAATGGENADDQNADDQNADDAEAKTGDTEKGKE